MCCMRGAFPCRALTGRVQQAGHYSQDLRLWTLCLAPGSAFHVQTEQQLAVWTCLSQNRFKLPSADVSPDPPVSNGFTPFIIHRGFSPLFVDCCNSKAQSESFPRSSFSAVLTKPYRDYFLSKNFSLIYYCVLPLSYCDQMFKVFVCFCVRTHKLLSTEQCLDS